MGFKTDLKALNLDTIWRKKSKERRETEFLISEAQHREEGNTNRLKILTFVYIYA